MTQTSIILIAVTTTLVTAAIVLAASFYWARSNGYGAGLGEHRWSQRGGQHALAQARHGCGENHGARLDQLAPYLEDALNVTASQQPQWNAFVAAIHDAGAAMQGHCGEGDHIGSAPQRLARFERGLRDGLASLTRIREATAALYASFTDSQKERFDDLMAHRGRRHARGI